MGTLDVPFYEMRGVSFALYPEDEILQLSVKEITNPVSLDVLLHPTYGGLYDPALGAVDAGEVCGTCSQNYICCPGHMGHIRLPMPVFNPVLFQTMFKMLKGTCFLCQRLMANKCKLHAFQAQLRALDFGLISLVTEIQDRCTELIGEDSLEHVNEEKVMDGIDQCLNEAIKGKEKKDSFHSANVKNVVELRDSLCKGFINGNLWRTNCPHCSVKPKALRTEHNSKVFFQRSFNKEQLKQAITKKLRKAEGVQKQQLDTKEMEEQITTMDKQQYLTPSFVQDHLRKVWKNDGHVIAKVFKSLDMQKDKERHPTDSFFINVLPVPPSRFRPRASLGDMKFDNPQTANYTAVLEAAIRIRNILRDFGKSGESQEIIANTKEINSEKLHYAWLKLQSSVNSVIDMDLDKVSANKQPGIRQLIEKKAGLFRMNMMGKRVNYACRSVISPDPYINTNEIGIPLVFASKLTYPQPVTPWNFHELKQAVLNGPDVYPGATHVELADGTRVILHAQKPTQREAIAKQLLTPSADGKLGSKKVYRHMKNGDVLLLNRQPTLHRPSIQAHRARVLGNEKTLRLHYSNCKAYNADFDGDEMNAHFPQDELSRAEAYTIAATDYQYLVPKDGTPLAGLIQDHMVSGVTLTLRGQFFCRSDYHQLVYGALTDKAGPIILLKPAICKPKVLWSGKQVLSTVLINITPAGKKRLNLLGTAKVSVKNWCTEKARPWTAGGEELEGNNMSESEVVIQDGELLVGVLDKGHYGPTAYGLVHSCYELYGGEMAGRLLTCLAKLFTCFLQFYGFTLGVKDILCLPKADKERANIMKAAAKVGPEAAAHAFNVKDVKDEKTLRMKYEDAHYSKEGELKDLDLAMKGKTDEYQNKIAKAIIPNGLLKHFPHNNLQLMVQSGAKGSSVNCMQISCLLGQIELEGRRPALMLNGKPLPSFPAYDMQPRASGFIAGRFLTGIRPQEYFFHCMAGREGLVDTAVKTSSSGYLQRCIIKHMEGLIVNYDQTVRDSDGSIVQYGEDGLDIGKTPYLQRKLLPFLIENQDQMVTPAEEADIMRHTDTDMAPSLWKKLRKWKKKHGEGIKGIHETPFLQYCNKKWESIKEKYPDEKMVEGRLEAASVICDKWSKMDDAKKSKYIKAGQRQPDPVLSEVNSSHYLGVVSEKYQDFMDNYINTNPDKLLKYEDEECRRWEISADRLRSLLYIKNLKAQVNPGEAVGLLAAQSIGEPSTQMTLNTFHFAGRGEMNVTLGIPRLREILMVASSSIKTPNMDVPILSGAHAMKKARLLKKKFTKVYLSQVLEDLEVTETLCINNDSRDRNRMYKLRFSFLPHDMYREDFYLTPSRILQYVENYFLESLVFAMKRKREELSKTSLLNTGSIKESMVKEKETTDAVRKDQEQDDIDDDDLHDGDATSTKRRERQLQGRDYQGEEDEKDEMNIQSDDDQEADEVDGDEGGKEKEAGDAQPEDTIGMMDTTLRETKKKKNKSLNKMNDARINHVLGAVLGATSYTYDADQELWCEVTLKVPLSSHKLDMSSMLETEARRAVVHQTKGISRCFLIESKGEDKPARLTIEGINLRELHRYHDCLDMNKIYTNDIHAVAQVYGVEAASRAIVKEVRDVFAAYGIGVDYRHLSLVADYMTFEGSYKAFNRTGINSNPSPFQKMSFETTMAFLKTAIITGASDDLTSPSARLIVGRTVKGGTGCFDVLQPT